MDKEFEKEFNKLSEKDKKEINNLIQFMHEKKYHDKQFEELLQQYIELSRKADDMEQRTEKAIKELQELYNLYKDDDCYTIGDKLENALNILKGGDTNES